MYYSKFRPNLATIPHPLNTLLQSSKDWSWTAECIHAFQQAKDCTTPAQILTHYDPTLPINPATDASAYGVSTVVSHVLPDGTKGPIAITSCTLNSRERNYAQLEKEAMLFGVWPAAVWSGS